MSKSEKQREFALQVVRQLRDAGHEALWAGGCVRDQLLGLVPKDYDVATSALPEQVRELFGRRRTLSLGAAFGVISVLGRNDSIEVATFRTDGPYVDGRHPQQVCFSTPEHDAQRRDFTINGLFFDPHTEQVIDYVDGRQDLQRRVVRAIGDPSQRFDEDKLRMLRAVRFATTFEFQIDEDTLAAIRAMAEQVNVVSAERIGAELKKILEHRQRSRGVQLLVDAELLQPLLPEVVELLKNQPQQWQETLSGLQRLAKAQLPVALAALLTGIDGATAVGAIGRRLRFSNREIDRASWLVGSLPLVAQADRLDWPQLQRVLVHDGVSDLMHLAEAMLGADHLGVEFARQRLALPTEQLDPEPLITGADLLALGLKPGPEFSRVLEHVRDRQLTDQLANTQEALAEVKRWIAEGSDPDTR